MFQQNSYRIPRYWRWLRHNMANTWRLTDIVCILLMCAVLLDYRMATFLAFVALVCLAKIGLIFKKKYKNPLYSPAACGGALYHHRHHLGQER